MISRLLSKVSMEGVRRAGLVHRSCFHLHILAALNTLM